MPNNQYQNIYEKALKDAEKARTTFDKIQNKPVETKLMTWLNYQLATKDSNFKCAESCQKFLAKEEPSQFKTNLIDGLDKAFPDEGWHLFKDVDKNNLILLQICQGLLLKHKHEGYAGSILELYENSQRSFDTSGSSLMLMCGNTYEDSPYSISHTTLGALTAQQYNSLASLEVAQKYNVIKHYDDVNKIIQDSEKKLEFITKLRKTPEKSLAKKEAQNILDDLVSTGKISPKKTEATIQNLVTSRMLGVDDATAMLKHFIKHDYITYRDHDHYLEKIKDLEECDELSTIVPIIDIVNNVKSIREEKFSEIKNEFTEKNKKSSKSAVSNEPPTESDELNNFLTEVMRKFSEACFKNKDGNSHSKQQHSNQALTTYLAFNDVKNDQGLAEKLTKLIHYLNNINKESKNDKKSSEFFCNTFLKVLHSLEKKMPEILSNHLSEVNMSTTTAITTKDTKTSFLSFPFYNQSSTISESLGELKQIINALTAIHSELTEDEKRISETALEDAASVSSNLSSLSG